MSRVGWFALLAGFAAFTPTRAQEIKSTFENSLEGWHIVGFNVPQLRVSGGNPGGYLFVDNNEQDIAVLSAPSKFLGDLSAYNGGQLLWDGNMLEADDPPFEAELLNYGTVSISGGGQTVTIDLVVGPPPQNTWTTFPVPLSAASFDVSEQQWSNILANVTGITINIEAIFGREKQGVDNVILRAAGQRSLTAVPASLVFQVDKHVPDRRTWQLLDVLSTKSANFTVRETGGAFLNAISPGPHIAPQAISIEPDPNLQPGIYDTAILVEAPGFAPIQVPVRIQVFTDPPERIGYGLPSTPTFKADETQYFCSNGELIPESPQFQILPLNNTPSANCLKAWSARVGSFPGIPGPANVQYGSALLRNNSGGSDLTFNWKAQAVAGGLEVDFGSLDFSTPPKLNGPVEDPVEAPVTKRIRIRNSGNEPVHVQVVLAQKDSMAFFQDFPDDLVLQPGQTHEFDMSFFPNNVQLGRTEIANITVMGSDGSVRSAVATGRTEINLGKEIRRIYSETGYTSTQEPFRTTITNPTETAWNIYFQWDRYPSNPGWNAPADVAIPAGGSETVTIAPPPGTSPGDEGVMRFGERDNLEFNPGILWIKTPKLLQQGNQLREQAKGNCQPTELLPLIEQPYLNKELTTGIPVGVSVRLIDNCGADVDEGQVTIRPASGDEAFALLPRGEGLWLGTWMPIRSQASAFDLEVFSFSVDGSLYGEFSVPVIVSANEDPPPLIDSLSITSSAAIQSGTPRSPGELVTIFGLNLVSGAATTLGFPLPTEFLGTQVFLGGQALPLLYVAPNQINVMIPFEAPVGLTQSLQVRRGDAFSAAVDVLIGPATPGIFTMAGSGTGQAMIVDYPGYQLFDPTNRAQAGEVFIVFLTGLGLTDPAVASGEAVPFDVLSFVPGEVSVTVGGVDASVAFAGLAPGFAGLYQINAVFSPGTPAGDAVPVTVKIGNATSREVTIATQ